MRRKESITIICRFCGDDVIAWNSLRKQCDKRKCRSARRRELQPRERFRDHLKNRYGITLEQYDRMLKEQNDKCMICSRILPSLGTGEVRNDRPSVDHDHKTGKIRGILCHQCNAGLGWFLDDPIRLRAAANYLERQLC